MRTKIAKWALRFIVLFAVLLTAGAVLEGVGSFLDRRRFPPLGTRVDIGDGRSLYLDCRGSGSPTVLLESGFRNWSPSWTAVQAEVATFTRVCSYDRAGLGMSDRADGKRTLEAATTDLATLLAHAHIARPYVLVGHSAGGMYQRAFALAHRADVAGLVLVDSDEPTDAADRRAVAEGRDDARTGVALELATRTGFLRFYTQVLGRPLGPPGSERYPEEAKVRFRADVARLGRAMNDEWHLYQSAYANTVDTSFGDLPLVVIVALGYREPGADRADWLARHEHQASLSSRGRLVVLPEAAHFVPLLEPRVVVDAIRDVMKPAAP